MATKPWYAWATPSGPIRLIEGDKMPPEPIQTNAWNGKDYRENAFNNSQKLHYEAALQAAKESSVPIQDQLRARKMCMLFGEIKPDTIYGPFSLRYEIQNTAIVSQNIAGMNVDVKQIAILYDDTPEKETHSIRCASYTSEALGKRGHIPGKCDCMPAEKEPQEDHDEGKRLLEKCDRTFESIRKIFVILKEAEPERLPELVRNIEIDFEGIQAVIRDYTRK